MKEALEQIAELEKRLDSYDPNLRGESLERLALLTQKGKVRLEPETNVVNMHCHTFYSFNALRPLAGVPGLAGQAARIQGGRASWTLTCSRAWTNSWALARPLACGAAPGSRPACLCPSMPAKEINSPGEPGVCYHMGIGFTGGQVPEAVAAILAGLGQQAGRAQPGILALVNAYLDPVTVDYERDVLPLTPAGNPTERHMVVAYVRAAEQIVPDPAVFWAGKLGVAADEMTDHHARFARPSRI